jgi:hypothetical protein
MEQLKRIYRVARWLMLAGTVITIFLVLKSPAPVAEALNPALAKQNAESFQQKLTELANAQSSGETGTEVYFTAPEVNSALSQATLPQPVPAAPTPASQPAAQAAAEQVPIKSTLVSFEDNVVRANSSPRSMARTFTSLWPATWAAVTATSLSSPRNSRSAT